MAVHEVAGGGDGQDQRQGKEGPGHQAKRQSVPKPTSASDPADSPNQIVSKASPRLQAIVAYSSRKARLRKAPQGRRRRHGHILCIAG